MIVPIDHGVIPLSRVIHSTHVGKYFVDSLDLEALKGSKREEVRSCGELLV